MESNLFISESGKLIYISKLGTYEIVGIWQFAEHPGVEQIDFTCIEIGK